jgi:hypothetical protein
MAVAPGRPAASSAPPQAPVVPAWLLHPTDQRLLALSLFVLLQAWKLAACLCSSAASTTVARWAAVDAGFVLGVGALRVPRLSWGWQGRALLVGGLVVLDWLLLAGGWRSVRSVFVSCSIAPLLDVLKYCASHRSRYPTRPFSRRASPRR